MLSRPHTSVASVDRSQNAATFGVLGALLGAIAIMGLFWLQNVNSALHDQQSVIEKLEKTLGKQDASLALELNAERLAAKEEVLDGLLNEVRVGSPPERFVAKYTEAVDDRETMRRRLDHQITLNESLMETATQLRKKEAARKREDAEREKEKSQGVKLDDQTEAEASMGVASVSSRNAERYQIAWWAAVAGWASCVVLAIGLLALIAQRAGPEPDGHTLPTPNP